MRRAALALLIMGFWLLPAGPAPAERITFQAGNAGRSVVVAANGMVAACHPLAAQIGLEVLRDGGTAVDAAIAVNAALGLLEPMSCGIGGDLFAIVWDAKSGRLHGLNASGKAPAAATVEWFRQRGHGEVPLKGALSWSIPGCVDGWEALRKRFGRKSLAALLRPSIEYAERGYPVPEVIAGYWRSAERALARDPAAAAAYLPGGRAPRAGEIFRNARLAATYRDLARKGRHGFYRGRVAREIVTTSRQHGGLFAEKDLEAVQAAWVDPVSSSYRGYDVWELPPNGQGIAALQMLNVLEGFHLAAIGPGSADYWHLLVEAKKLAYADRARYYADTEFARVPVKELISKSYAERQRRRISRTRAAVGVEPGDPRLAMGDTTYLCVVDKDRSCVSLIQSNFHSFGSGLCAGEAGFAMQNRGALFSLETGHPNRLEPGKRPFHTIIPAMVTRQGKPWFVFGVMGGDMQPQGHVQVLVNLIDFKMNVQEAGEAPRVEHVGSATPTGAKERPNGGTVQAERGLPAAVLEGLRTRGHQVSTVRTNGGGYQGILIHPETGVLHGGSEARKDGCAVGY